MRLNLPWCAMNNHYQRQNKVDYRPFFSENNLNKQLAEFFFDRTRRVQHAGVLRMLII